MHRQLLGRPLTKENVVPPIRSVTIPARKPTVPELKPTPQASSAVKVISGPALVSHVLPHWTADTGWNMATGGGMDETVEVAAARAGRFEQWAAEQATGGVNVYADPIGPKGTGVAAYHVTLVRDGGSTSSQADLDAYRGIMKAIDRFE
jgi:hypothetical protein